MPNETSASTVDRRGWAGGSTGAWAGGSAGGTTDPIPPGDASTGGGGSTPPPPPPGGGSGGAPEPINAEPAIGGQLGDHTLRQVMSDSGLSGLASIVWPGNVCGSSCSDNRPGQRSHAPDQAVSRSLRTVSVSVMETRDAIGAVPGSDCTCPRR